MSHNIQKRGSVYYFRRRIPNDLLTITTANAR